MKEEFRIDELKFNLQFRFANKHWKNEEKLLK